MVDKKILVAVYGLLPLKDCGACGLKTCKEFAEKLILGGKKVFECPHLQEENAESITLFLEEYFR